MATTNPFTTEPHPNSSSHSRSRSGAGQNNIPSRPTTPLRPPSRTSLRASQSTPTAGASINATDFPLTALEPAFGEFSDAMADLEANMMHLQLLNDYLNRFNENFGAFLYGMNMSAFCVDFPEAPIPQSFSIHKDTSNNLSSQSPFIQRSAPPPDTEATFLTNDTSFIENPPTSSKPSSKFSSVPSSSARTPARGTAGRGRAGGASGIARGTSTRGARGGARGSGIARGVGTTRGRGVR